MLFVVLLSDDDEDEDDEAFGVTAEPFDELLLQLIECLLRSDMREKVLQHL